MAFIHLKTTDSESSEINGMDVVNGLAAEV